MGNWFQNTVNAVKKGVVDTGHAVGKVGSNPLVLGGLSLIPGVGIPAAAAIGGLSGLIKPGGNIGTGLRGAATGAAAGAAGGLVKGGIGAIAKGGLGSLIRGGGADNKGNFGLVGDIGGRLGGGGLGGALGLGGGGGGGPSLLDLGLGGLSAYNAAQLGQKSEDYAKKASDLAHQNYDERGGLRAAGVAGMLNPSPSALGRESIGNLGGIASRNPFGASSLRMAPVAGGGLGGNVPGQPGSPTGPMVLGQAATPEAAQRSFGNVQDYLKNANGVGNLSQLLKSARAGL